MGSCGCTCTVGRLRRVAGDRKSPKGLGTVTVGEMIAIGSDVETFAVGDTVYGDRSICQTHTVSAAQLRPVPAGMDPHAVVCGARRVALSGVRVTYP